MEEYRTERPHLQVVTQPALPIQTQQKVAGGKGKTGGRVRITSSRFGDEDDLGDLHAKYGMGDEINIGAPQNPRAYTVRDEYVAYIDGDLAPKNVDLLKYWQASQCLMNCLKMFLIHTIYRTIVPSSRLYLRWLWTIYQFRPLQSLQNVCSLHPVKLTPSVVTGLAPSSWRPFKFSSTPTRRSDLISWRGG